MTARSFTDTSNEDGEMYDHAVEITPPSWEVSPSPEPPMTTVDK
jgi:hypothetical protein